MMADLDVIIHDLGDDGAGHMEVTGNFVEVGGLDDFACSNKPFTKAGQNITPDLSDCRDVFMTDITYCPDQGSVQMTSSDEGIRPDVITLSRVACSSREAKAVAAAAPTNFSPPPTNMEVSV